MLRGVPREDGLVDGIVPVGDASNAHRETRTVVDVEARELGDRALVDSLLRVERAFQGDLSFGGHLQVHRPAGYKTQGFAQQAARDFVLIVTQFDVHLRGDEHSGVVAYRHRDLQRLGPSLRPLYQPGQVVGWRNPYHELLTAFHPQSRDGYVAPTRLWVFGNDHPAVAALAVRENATPLDVPLEDIREILRKHGAIIPTA